MKEIKAHVATIEKFLQRVSEDAQEDWKNDEMERKSLLFNLDCLSQAAIGCGSLVIEKKGMSKPKAVKDVFDVLQRTQLVEREVTNALKKMTGFITLAGHDSSSLNIEILESLVYYELHFFKDFCKATLKLELD